MDKLIESLRETLLKLGLDENAVDAALQEAMAKASAEEEPAPEGDSAPETEPSEETPLPPEAPVEEGESESPSEELPPVEEAPAPVEEEQVAPESEALPVEPAPAPVPQFDPAPILAQLEEKQKAIDGLLSRVTSLEEALKNAGVIEGTNPVSEVGDPLPSAAPQNPTDDVLGSVLSEMNGHRRY